MNKPTIAIIDNVEDYNIVMLSLQSSLNQYHVLQNTVGVNRDLREFYQSRIDSIKKAYEAITTSASTLLQP